MQSFDSGPRMWKRLDRVFRMSVAERLRTRPKVVHLQDGTGRVLRRRRSPEFIADLTHVAWLQREWRISGAVCASVRYSARHRFGFRNAIWIDGRLAMQKWATPFVPRFECKVQGPEKTVPLLLEASLSSLIYTKIDWLRLTIEDEVVYEEGDEHGSAWESLKSQVLRILA